MQPVTDPDLLNKLNSGAPASAPQQPVQQQRGTFIADPNAGIDRTSKEVSIQKSSADMARDTREEARKIDDTDFDRASKLRDEYQKSTVVKDYQTAIQAFTGALNTKPTPQGDLSLVYSYAKAMDPGSTVREGEADTVANSDSAFGSYYQRAKKELQGDGSFRPEVRKRLRMEIANRVRQSNLAYNQIRKQYAGLAEQYGQDPQSVLGDHFGQSFKPDIERFKKTLEPREPEMVGGMAKGSDITFENDQGPFNRSEALAAEYGVSPENEQAIVGFFNANKGNKNFTADNIAKFYESMGLRSPEPERMNRDAELVRAGSSEFGLFDTGDLEKRRMAELEGRADTQEEALGDAGLTSRFTSGAMLGLDDELSGAVGGVAGLFNGEGLIEGYENARDTKRLVNERADERTGLAGDVAEFAGGAVLPIPGAAGVKTVGGAAKLGAKVGGVAGFGYGEGAEESLGGAATGAALGAGTGAAIGYFGPRLLSKLSGKKAERVGNYQAAKDAGIDPSIGDVRGGGAAFVENALAASPGSAGRMEAANATRLTQAAEGVDKVASKFGGGDNLENAGEALQSGALKWIAKAKGEGALPAALRGENPLERGVVGKAYDAIPISPKAKAELDNSISYMQGLNEAFDSNPALQKELADSNMNQWLDALSTEDGLSWSGLKAFRSFIGEKIGKAKFSDKDLESSYRGLYGALSEDMKATAAKVSPKALEKWQKANTLNREVEGRIDNVLKQVLGNDYGKSPAGAAAFMQRISKSNKASTDTKKLAELRKSIPKEEWEEASSSIIRTLGQPSGSEGRAFAPATFWRNYADINPTAKNIIFGNGEKRKALDEFAGVMDRMKNTSGKVNNSNTAPILNILMNITNAGTLGGQAVAANVLARAWQKPWFIRWASGVGRMEAGAARSGNALKQDQLDKQLNNLERITRNQTGFAMDAAGLQSVVRDAFAQAPGKLAATEKETQE